MMTKCIPFCFESLPVDDVKGPFNFVFVSQPEKFNSWRDDYQYGASNEIYSETFSKSFYDLTFRQAAE